MKSADAAPAPMSVGPFAVPSPAGPWQEAQFAAYRTSPGGPATWLPVAASWLPGSGREGPRNGPPITAQASNTSDPTAASPSAARRSTTTTPRPHDGTPNPGAGGRHRRRILVEITAGTRSGRTGDMTELHQLAAAAVAIETLALVGAALSSWLAGRRSAGVGDQRLVVDRLVLALTGTVAVAGLVGALLVVGGARPADALHLLYGIVAVVTPIGAWWLGGHRRRPGGAASAGPATRMRRDAWIAVAAVVLLGVEVRLLMTG
jgi:hypothetical protein